MDLWTLCAIVQSELLYYCANWTIVNNKLLYQPTSSEHKDNKSIDNYMDSCYVISSWLIAWKTILIKKNHLTCDHTTRRSTSHINIQL